MEVFGKRRGLAGEGKEDGAGTEVSTVHGALGRDTLKPIVLLNEHSQNFAS